MIEITFGKMYIPENERFIGFAGDNLHSSKTFVLKDFEKENCIYRLYLEFFEGGYTNYFVLDSKIENGSTYLTWNIKEDHILNNGLIKAQIKAFCDDDIVFHTSHDYFLAAPSNDCNDISKKELSEFLDYEKRLNEILSKITGYEEGFVPSSRKIADLSLTDDITAEMLSTALNTYPVLRLSSAPTKATAGKVGQLAFERSTKNGVDFVNRLYFCVSKNTAGDYIWVMLSSDEKADKSYVDELFSSYDTSIMEILGGDEDVE